MNQQTKVGIISGLIMISIIILLTYYGYPANRSVRKTERNSFWFNQNMNVKVNPVKQKAEVTPYCFKKNISNQEKCFNIFGPPEKIKLDENMNNHLRVQDLDLVVN